MKVLVIDDNDDIRWCLREQFKRKGFKVFEAQNGEEGLKALEARPFAFVLCDIQMPVLDGVGFLKRARELNQALPIFIMTAHSPNYTKQEVLGFGATAYIEKPLTMEAIETLLKQFSEPTN